jgi:serine/threonine-protein phosphatase 2A regulatory subunit A
VLLAMAEELGKLAPHVGGPQHAHVLLAPLESLTQVEETVVRDKAVESICAVGAQLPDASVAEHFVPLIKVREMGGQEDGCGGQGRGGGWAQRPGRGTRQQEALLRRRGRAHAAWPRRRTPRAPPSPLQRLAQGEWFTSRVASTGLFPIAYPLAPPATRGELRTLYAGLCRDETPMVRRAAAQKLGALAAVAEKEVVASELLPLFTDLTGDGG